MRSRRPSIFNNPSIHFICGSIVATLSVLIIGLAVQRVIAKKHRGTYSATTTLGENLTLDEASQGFFAKTHNLKSGDDCFPMHIHKYRGVNILYLHCPKDAYKNDGKATRVTKNFKVSQELARRFHFWRRVYSLWSEEQYVLHLANYPEVVLEIGDGSSLMRTTSPMARHHMINAVLNQHRESYRMMLRRMHERRYRPETFTPAMQRIAASMQHIKDDNKYVQGAMSIRVQKGQRDQIGAGLSMATKYMHAVDVAFEQEGLPSELSKIAFIESSFNLKAYSKVGAAGIYQIMPSTGRQYLMVNDFIDERRDPVKSAHAAARILRENYLLTGEWPLAITSYNHGVNGIMRATKKVRSKKIEDLIARYDGPAFGFASKNFYTGFLGILATLEDRASVFPDVPQLEPLRFSEYRLTTYMSISEIRRKYALNNATIMEYNPDISRHVVTGNGVLPRGYILKIPATDGSAEAFTNVYWQY